MARNDEMMTAHEDRTIEITINKKPVEIVQGEHTGREIKQAAIDAGLPVQLDFVLTEIHGGSPNRPTIGNEDTVNVHPGSKFSLIADDDDS
jgi:hypothetical protein